MCAKLTQEEQELFISTINSIQLDYAFHRDVAINIVLKAWKATKDIGLSNRAFFDKVEELSDFAEGILWLEMGYAGNNCFDERFFGTSKSNNQSLISEAKRFYSSELLELAKAYT